MFREDERQRKGSGGLLIGEREGTYWLDLTEKETERDHLTFS